MACPLNCCPSQEVVPRFEVLISLRLNERILGAGTVCHWQITFLVMGWLTKILKGSSYKGHSHRKYGHDRTWDKPRDSVEEDVEFAKALSLSELDQKGKSVIEDESESEDDEQFAKVESDSDEQPTRFHSTMMRNLPKFSQTMMKNLPNFNMRKMNKVLKFNWRKMNNLPGLFKKV
ncbi:protein DA1-related 1-like isoform X3 [Prunus yedoensis var. nudiflora]|uniref:Protein DA1-related 1-like isoform X3 n=1 Tax=Prunus yedoensis var. nudiflora TaxID=2094558 RepID=A0A314YB11_PRUYE|nr:protein DA1-related 1-like isoform X3 [Prunus yedoensis var. nudiflora]